MFLPVRTEVLCLYAQFLSRFMKSIQSITNSLRGVKTMQVLSGYSTEDIKGGYLDFSNLSELENIYITEICMKKQ